MVGGYGSGKTLPGCIVGVGLSLAIPGNIGIVLRRSYPKLHDSTLRILLEVLERANIEGIEYRENRDGFPHRIILPNGSEIHARESRDLGKFLGPEYGWFLVDEAQEEPWETFKGLKSRLRLPRAGEYLKGILATNPPPKTHWIAKEFGLQPGVKVETDPISGYKTKYHLIRSSTRNNPHLPPGYISDLIKGEADSEIARIVDGFYGFSQEGIAVYPGFRLDTHVTEDAFRPGVSIIRSWDFGFRHPAVTWHQTWRCNRGEVHWSILAEIDAQEVQAEVLFEIVMDASRKVFPDTNSLMFVDVGDRAGAARSDKGPGPIVRLSGPPYNLPFKYKYCPIEPGLELIRDCLKKVCQCGRARLLVHRSCVNVIEGFVGGYRYSKKIRQVEDKPLKDGFYDDYMDSVRYAAENVVRAELKGIDYFEKLTAPYRTRAEVRRSSYQWMEEGVMNG